LIPRVSFSLMTPRPPSSTLFPYTTLFRSPRGSSLLRMLSTTALNLHGACSCTSARCPRRGRFVGCAVIFVDHARGRAPEMRQTRSEEHTSELQSLTNLVCRLLLEKKNNK